MKLVHITGPAGAGKSTALQAIFHQLSAEKCLYVMGDSTAARISRELQRRPAIRTVLIDEFDPARIDLSAITTHEDSPLITFYVAHLAGAA